MPLMNCGVLILILKNVIKYWRVQHFWPYKVQGVQATFQGPLFEIPFSFELSNDSDLCPGEYMFYFGVYGIDKNSSDPSDTYLAYDTVAVTINPQ